MDRSTFYVTREDFTALAEILDGTLTPPDYNHAWTRIWFKVEGPKGTLDARIEGTSIERAEDGEYYGRRETWTHVRLQFPQSLVLKGAGARSDFDDGTPSWVRISEDIMDLVR